MAKVKRLERNGISEKRRSRNYLKHSELNDFNSLSVVGHAKPTIYKGKNGTATKILRYEKKRTTNNIKKFDSEFMVAIGNVRSLVRPDQVYELVNEAIIFKLGILAIVEHRKILNEPWDCPKNLGKGWQWLLLSAEKGADGIHGSIGGVGVIMSPTWAKAYSNFIVVSTRTLVVTFDGKHNKLHIIIHYAHPATSVANVEKNKIAYSKITEHLDGIPKGDIALTLLDANATLVPDNNSAITNRVLYGPNKATPNANTGVFREFLEESDNYPLNCRFRQPRYITFWGPNKRTAQLDYILVKGKWVNCFTDAFVHPFCSISSDHAMVVARGKWRLKAQVKKLGAPRLDFSMLKDPTISREFLDRIKEFALDSTIGIDANYANFVNIFIEACSSANLQPMTKEQKRIPWEDSSIRQLRRDRVDAKANFIACPTSKNKKILGEKCAEMKQGYLTAQEAYISAQCRKIEENFLGNNSKAAYQLLNSLTGRNARKSSKINGENGDIRLEKFREHFQNVLTSTPITGAEPRNIADDISVINNVVLFPTDPPTFRDGEFNMVELQAVLKTLENGRAAGIDEIPPEVFKVAGIDEVILPIINHMFSVGEVPEQWKVLIMVPVPKKGDLSKPQNYRGISLMVIIAKIYNKLLLFRIRDGLESKLRQTQNGFRPGRSTVHQITALRMLCQYALSHTDVTLVLLFIDYMKAFDSVAWGVLEAVLKAYQIPEKIVKAVMSLYANPSARVRTADGLSNTFHLKQGVLQGDTLAPYLFVIVMDYIMRSATEGKEALAFTLIRDSPTTHHITRHSSMSQLFPTTISVGDLGYADDYALSSGGQNINLQTAIGNTQVVSNSVEIQGRVTGLGMNGPKTESLIINGGQIYMSKVSNDLIKLLGGDVIPTVRDFKYLGSYLIDSLTDIRTRLASGWKAIRSAAKFFKNDSISSSLRIRVFKVIAQSIFMYGCQSWILTDAARQLLQGAYTRMLRFVRNLSYNDHPNMDTIYGDVPSILAQVTHQRMRMLGRAFRSARTCPQPLVSVLTWMLGERQVTQTVTAVMSSATKTRNYGYITQLVTEVREITGNRKLSSLNILHMLRGHEWESSVVDKVYSSRSKLFARLPLQDMRSVFGIARSPPMMPGDHHRPRPRRISVTQPISLHQDMIHSPLLTPPKPSRSTLMPTSPIIDSDSDMDSDKGGDSDSDDDAGSTQGLRVIVRPRNNFAGTNTRQFRKPKQGLELTPISDRYRTTNPSNLPNDGTRRSGRIRKSFVLEL